MTDTAKRDAVLAEFAGSTFIVEWPDGRLTAASTREERMAEKIVQLRDALARVLMVCEEELRYPDLVTLYEALKPYDLTTL